MDEDDERSAYYNSVQDPSADDSVSLLSFSVFSSFKGLLSFFLSCDIMFSLILPILFVTLLHNEPHDSSSFLSIYSLTLFLLM